MANEPSPLGRGKMLAALRLDPERLEVREGFSLAMSRPRVHQKVVVEPGELQ
jgi:hypothetical protein